jgi:hypothetical protein
MRHAVLSRYEHSDDGSVIIDVAASRVEDLYNNFDRNAPYIRRDLDQDLVEYLIGCAREVGQMPFLIRFSLAQSPDEDSLARVRRSVKGYFDYRAEIETQQITQMLRKAAVLFLVGLAILFLSVSVNQWLGAQRTVVANVFAEGLTVAAWVSLWEALATILVEWFPHRRAIGLYRRLANAPLHCRSEATVPHEATRAAAPAG